MKMKRTRRVFDPKEKITAVLSIWTQQKNMTQICREMSISWSLSGPVAEPGHGGDADIALSPKRPDPSKGLNPRLVQLIDKKLSNKQPGQAGKTPSNDPAESQLNSGHRLWDGRNRTIRKPCSGHS